MRLALHLVQGLLTVLVVYPGVTKNAQLGLRRRWSARLLAILGVHVNAHGETLQRGCMLIANHISWLDIFVINALVPAAFVAKAEVRAWPLIGWLAAKNDTVFLRRGSRGHARLIGQEIARILDDDRNVTIFPEGTTSDGRSVLHFHAALLQPAIDAGRPVQALALRYRNPDGSYCGAPAYEGETTLMQSLAAILAAPRIRAEVEAFSAIAPGADASRREVALAAHRSIRESVER